MQIWMLECLEGMKTYPLWVKEAPGTSGVYPLGSTMALKRLTWTVKPWS